MFQAVSKALPIEPVCIGIHVDLASRDERQGWRVSVAVEAQAHRDDEGCTPAVAECLLEGRPGDPEPRAVGYLNFDGSILRLRAIGPYAEGRKRAELPEELSRNPYFFRHQVQHGYVPPLRHLLDGESVRTFPHRWLAPLRGDWHLPDAHLVDTQPLQAAVEEARRHAGASLLLRPEGWYVSTDLPEWHLHETGGRHVLGLRHSGWGSAGNVFAIDRLEDALAHGRRLHGCDPQVVGEVRMFEPSLRPDAMADPRNLARRLAGFLAVNRRPNGALTHFWCRRVDGSRLQPSEILPWPAAFISDRSSRPALSSITSRWERA